MKHVSKVVTALLLAAALMLTAVGCSSGKIVAKVGDRTISLKTYQNAFTNYESYNGYYFSYDLDTEEGLADYQDYILDTLIQREMYIYQAGQLGITLTEDEIAECQATADEDYQDTWDYYYSNGQSAGSSDPNAYANSQLSSMLSNQGLTITSYKKQLLEDAENSKLIEKVETYLENEGTPDADELKAAYDEELASQKEAVEADPNAYFTYETYWTYYESYGYDLGCMPLYQPAGIYVRQILVEDEATANTIYEALQGGADFEELLSENNTDTAEPDEGYFVFEGCTQYVDAFTTAAVALTEDGQYSEVFSSDYGYHILMRTSAVEAHEIPYEDVQASIDPYFTSKLQSEYVDNTMDAWLATEGLVVKYEDVYRSVK